MSGALQPPVVFLAFANDRQDGRHLPDLDRERRRLRSVFQRGRPELCQLEVRAGVTRDDLLGVLQDRALRDRIAVFHFAGHASGSALCFEDAAGAQDLAHREGLARLLGQQQGLRLVVLNGCSTVGHVDALLAAGVPAVVATSRHIPDALAVEFAAAFYGSLAQEAPLERAFQEAVGAVHTRETPERLRSFLPAAEAPAWGEQPWLLRMAPERPDLGSWSLGAAAADPLFGLPGLPRRPLPEAPCPGEAPYTERWAELFRGRGGELRALWDALDAGLVVLHGPAGVGKSSLLRAGLLPRLEGRARVRCLGGAPDALPGLLDEELRAEARPGDVIIVDQLERALGDPSQLDPALPAAFARARAQGRRLVLSLRSDALRRCRDLLRVVQLRRHELALPRLSGPGLEAVVGGLGAAPRYELQVAPELPRMIRDDVEDYAASLPVAPTVQLVLRALWQVARAAPAAQVLDASLYRRLKGEGLYEQVGAAVARRYPLEGYLGALRGEEALPAQLQERWLALAPEGRGPAQVQADRLDALGLRTLGLGVPADATQGLRCFVRGAPGVGKSALLQQLVRRLAGEAERGWIPIRVSAAALLEGHEVLETDLAAAHARDAGALRAALEDKAAEGRLLLILDGLEEVPAARHAEVLAAVERFAQRWPRAAIVMAARPDVAPPPSFQPLRLTRPPLVYDPQTDRVHPCLPGRALRVGRPHRSARPPDIVCTKRSVSRRHCDLYAEADGSVRVVDLGTPGGTTINGRRVEGSAQAFANDRVVLSHSYVLEVRGPAVRGGGEGPLDARYRLIRRLHSGPFGAVFEAEDTLKGRRCAIKRLELGETASPTLVERFRREATLAGRLGGHPHIVEVFDIGAAPGADNELFIAMEFVPGESLDRAGRAGLTPEEAVRIVAETARAVAFAHAEGVVHRDLNPHNVLVTEAPRRSARLTDFGLAKALSETESITAKGATAIVGCLFFSAPELVDDPVQADPRCDVYSLGGLLYFALTRRPPLEGPPFDLPERARRGELRPPSELVQDLDPELETICLEALQPDPASRLPSAAAFAERLEDWLRRHASPPARWV